MKKLEMAKVLLRFKSTTVEELKCAGEI